MHLSFAFVVLVTAVVVAVSAGVYPARAGSKTGAVKDEAREDDRFHLQSPDGQYVFGYTTGNQGRAELRTKDGTVTGYYSYVSGNGQLVYVNYVADKDGYRVLSNAGVPSASVTVIANGVERKPSGSENDFQKIFSDFTKRIKDNVVGQIGQTSVTDPIDEGQHQVVVDPPTLYPSKEIKPSRHEDRTPFPDWNEVKISTTQKTTDGINHDEGQRQQELVDPIWDDIKITTQKSNVKGYDNDGQGSFDNNWSAEKNLKPIPLVPYQPELPAKGGYPDEVLSDDHIREITTEVAADSRIGTESTVIIDDTQNNSPVTKSVSIINDSQTTIPYYNRIGQTTEGYYQTTVVSSGVKQFEEFSTVQAISESATDHNRIVDGNKEKTEDPLEAGRLLTTVRTLQQDEDKSFGNVAVTTEDPSAVRTNFQTTDAFNVDNVTVSTSSPMITIYQPEHSRVGDTETATATADIQYVTEQNKDGFEFRTLEPTEIIGTTVNPATAFDFGPSDEAQVQEIIWPEIPQEPIPQVLVPLDPYPEEYYKKNVGVKTQMIRSSRPARHLELTETKSNAVNVTETETMTSSYNDNENTKMFNFPKYFLSLG